MTHKSLFLLGRQPFLGRAELESLFGAENLEPIGEQAMACSLPWEDIPFERLGGAVRLAKPLGVLRATDWRDIARQLPKYVRKELDLLPNEGKVKLGLSTFGLEVRPQQIVATGLELKKVCRNVGRSARLVPNTEPELSSAQVLHNQLTGELGLELLLIRNGNQTYLAQTKRVQDIEAYAARDQNRPKRDARVGMLPPKLAQIIVNLGVGALPASDEHIVLDPFCGTGVVLQEALLMGYGAYGTDVEQRMIDFTQKNLDWLGTGRPINNFALEVGDATTHDWKQPFSAVASETYLGRPFTSWPDGETLRNTISTCNTVIKKFLVNIVDQIPVGTRLCLAVPEWKNPNGKDHSLPLLDHLEEMGYNRVRFEHAGAHELVYFRPEQIVARQLLVITRN